MNIIYKLLIIGVILISTPLMSAQVCNSSITPSTPNIRFIVNNDGTVSDTQTGLMWMQCILGQSWTNNNCTGSGVIYDWSQALGQAGTFSHAGLNDWRLPNISELTSIVEESCDNPSINLIIFPATPTNNEYWSSTPYAGLLDLSWNVDFYNGHDHFQKRNLSKYVRFVRGN